MNSTLVVFLVKYVCVGRENSESQRWAPYTNSSTRLERPRLLVMIKFAAPYTSKTDEEKANDISSYCCIVLKK